MKINQDVREICFFRRITNKFFYLFIFFILFSPCAHRFSRVIVKWEKKQHMEKGTRRMREGMRSACNCACAMWKQFTRGLRSARAQFKLSSQRDSDVFSLLSCIHIIFSSLDFRNLREKIKKEKEKKKIFFSLTPLTRPVYFRLFYYTCAHFPAPRRLFTSTSAHLLLTFVPRKAN